ncbi:hypothetical protein LX73_0192 [Fodinibius salinus]|uniref:Uncharacterized protein n=1 Tax=Fodinibius salinus TaxID=860790 RepID=A0A5D3YPD7_9BACT|nr:hypothetical protein [Fodinibius salinus]TYP94899.1 hypothetical protein LX73_0192 [Fodinibius salinus]
MNYIAAIDYEHLDNGVFLTSLAQSLSQQQDEQEVRSILIHSDSEYTERVIQTGVMREQARIRSVKDLNKRLVALLADEGVSTVGINPNKRNVITHSDGELNLDQSFLDTLPKRSVLLLSTLIQDLDTGEPTILELPRLMNFISDELSVDERFIFTKSDESEVFTKSKEMQHLQWQNMDETFRDRQIPNEFTEYNRSVRLSSARDFSQLPKLDHSTLIE